MGPRSPVEDSIRAALFASDESCWRADTASLRAAYHRRGRTRLLVPAVLVLSLLTPALSRAAVPTPIHAGRIGIGDSVMLDGKSGLLAHGFRRVDAVVSRQFSSAPSVIAHWRNRGLLPTKVVVHLGTNGQIHAGDCDATVRAVGSRQIYFVNLKLPRRYRTYNNNLLAACVHRHGNTHLIDWFGYSHRNVSWFAPDGYHLTARGASYYARFVSAHS